MSGEVVGVGGFVEAVLERVCEARAGLTAALDTESPYEVAVAQGELEDALRLARMHDIDPGEGALEG
ncbi:hypothetical protein ABZ153_39070 [Streptomyces sp. NPDC006290]|uniref:hypothetical protein n=1 Tax=Streptomyces sp. NPDC006290 TaxID=3156745 RepID=UPI0033B1B1B2